MATRTDDEDVLTGYNFVVEIDGFLRAGFSKVSGLSIKTDVVAYRDGGDNATKKKRPGQTDFPDVTLERGIIIAKGMGSADVTAWTEQIFKVSQKIQAASNNFRRTVTIKVRDAKGVVVRQHKLVQCWVSQADLQGDLDAAASNVLMEKLTLTHEGISTEKT